MLFEFLTAVVGVVGGAIASVTGFGVGSCLMPWVALQTGVKVAVAAMAIPHRSGTASGCGNSERTPIYLWSEWEEVTRVWPLILAASAGVLLGTLLGQRVLRQIPERLFRKIVSGLIAVLGLATIVLIDAGGK